MPRSSGILDNRDSSLPVTVSVAGARGACGCACDRCRTRCGLSVS